MNEHLLYETLKKIMDNEAFELNGHDFGDWSDTVYRLAETPSQLRGRVFQALDRFHRGEMTRLLAMYQPELEQTSPTSPADDREEQACPALPAEVQPDPDLAAEASPWLNAYIDFSRHWSPRSYSGYHQACGLWLLSTIAARRVAFHYGDKRYTNLYLIMAGASTLHAKTRAAKIAIDTLKQSGLSWFRAPDRATPQAFLSYLVGQAPANYDTLDEERRDWAKLKLGFAAQRGWFYEEFGNGIAAMTRGDGYMADFRGLLREFDDCPDRYEYITKTRGAEIVQRPYLAMLANLTPADLRPVAGRGAGVWGDGFLARFSFITPPKSDISLARFPLGERLIPEEITKPLNRWHKRLGLPLINEVQEAKQGSFIPEPTALQVVAPPSTSYLSLDPEVVEASYAYNFALLTLISQLDQEDLNSSYARLHEKALRVATLLASLAGCESVNIKHWMRALQIAEEWRASLHRIYEQITNQGGYSAEAELERRILEVVRHQGNPTAGQISNYVKSHSTMQVGRAADGLAAAGLLQASHKVWGSRVIKRYRVVQEEDIK